MFDQPPQPEMASSLEEGSARDPRILGDAEFIAGILDLAGRRSPGRIRNARPLESEIADAVTRVIERFVALCEVRLPKERAEAWRRVVILENVRSGARKRPLPMVRALSASCLIEQRIATASQAARFFGCGSHPVSVRRRHFYEVMFRNLLGAERDILLPEGAETPSCRSARGAATPRRDVDLRRRQERPVPMERTCCQNPRKSS
jgi:hypothetical protein